MANVMKQTVLALVAAFATVAIVVPAAAQEAAGDWVGVVEIARGNHLPLLVHIKRDNAGILSGTMDSPAQGAHGLPLAEIAARNVRLTFAVPSIGGNYAGEWVATVKAWRGEWRQRGMHWPLELSVAPPPLQVDWQMPPDVEIARLIADRNAPRPGQGIVIGVLGPDGQRFVAGGCCRQDFLGEASK